MKKVLMSLVVVVFLIAGCNEDVKVAKETYRPIGSMVLPKTPDQSAEFSKWETAYGPGHDTQLYYNTNILLALADQHSAAINKNRQYIGMILNPSDPNSLASVVVKNRAITAAVIGEKMAIARRLAELENRVTEMNREAEMAKEKDYNQLQAEAKLLGITANQSAEALAKAIAAKCDPAKVSELMEQVANMETPPTDDELIKEAKLLTISTDLSIEEMAKEIKEVVTAEHIANLRNLSKENLDKLEATEEANKNAQGIIKELDGVIEKLKKQVDEGTPAPVDPDGALGKLVEMHESMLEDRKTFGNDYLVGTANGIMTAIGLITGDDVTENMLKPVTGLTPASARTQTERLLKECRKYITIADNHGVPKGTFRTGINEAGKARAIEICGQLGLKKDNYDIHTIELESIPGDEDVKADDTVTV